MNRKKFLATSMLAALSMTTFGSISRNKEGNFTGDCETTSDILGPFYRPKAPIRSNLMEKGMEGTEIRIKGAVFGEDCASLLEGAMVEIWHCNAAGEYDNTTRHFRQRARWKTDETGNYFFDTIMPGKYLNGRLYRPAHIHFRVTKNGYKELISQIYFAGDPHIENDPWASATKAKERILSIIPEDTKGRLVVNFDIYMSRK